MTMDDIQNVINATVTTRRKHRTIEITGRRNIQALIALSRAGPKGIIAQEQVLWAYRLSAYIHILRHDYGLPIETQRERHDGGYHARYALTCHVELSSGG